MSKKMSKGQATRDVLHNLVASMARQPAAIVKIRRLRRSEDLEGTNGDILGGSPGTRDEAPPIPKITTLVINASAKQWLEVVSNILREGNVKPEDLWVLINCDGHGEPVTFATRMRNDILAFTNQPHGTGSIRAFVRLQDLYKAIVERGAPEMAVQSMSMAYVSDGRRYEMSYGEVMENEIVQPIAPPTSGYESFRGLGSAITEAAKFAKEERDHMAMHAVQISPLRDGTGNAEIVALSDTIGYRRVLHLPKLTDTITLVPNWLLRAPRLVGATVALKKAGPTYIWMVTSTGMIAGMQVPDMPYPTNYLRYFTPLDGVINFTVEEAKAVRRAIAQAGEIDEHSREIGISASAGRFRVRGQETVEVTCQGDQMGEILIDPHLLTRGLQVRGVLTLEFKKEDPEHNIRLAGKDVAISVMPCHQHQA